MKITQYIVFNDCLNVKKKLKKKTTLNKVYILPREYDQWLLNVTYVSNWYLNINLIKHLVCRVF